MRVHLITRRRHVQYVRHAAIDRRMQHAECTPTYDPLAWLRDDVAAGTFPRATDTVTETTRYRRDVHGDTIAKATVQAPGYMVQLERLHRDYSRVTRGYSALMAHEASGEGRGTIQAASRIPGAVNGTETRVQPRWTPSRKASMTTTNERGETVPVDWTCYRVMTDGTRVPLVSATTARKRKAKASKADATARLQRIATTAGHVEAVTAS